MPLNLFTRRKKKANEALQEIHLLITDVIMPRMGGRELSEKLSEKFLSMKVLFMTGYTDDSIVYHGILEPGLAFISKPFSPKEIAKKVRQVLDDKG